MDGVGTIIRKYRGGEAIKRNKEIVRENQRLLTSIDQILNGGDYHAKDREKMMPRPEYVPQGKLKQYGGL